jgi:hypothetical protein
MKSMSTFLVRSCGADVNMEKAITESACKFICNLEWLWWFCFPKMQNIAEDNGYTMSV